MPSPASLRDLWLTMRVKPEASLTLCTTARQIVADRRRYEAAAAATGVPWAVIGVLHHLECGGSFTRHLHNGDPLTARTVRVPQGRPVEGRPPFTWTASAIDALRFDSLDQVNWRHIAAALDALERYNGLGYRKRRVNSPYLWAGTTHYTKGKFVSDGKFDPAAVSKQIGAAPLLQWFVAEGLLSFQT